MAEVSAAAADAGPDGKTSLTPQSRGNDSRRPAAEGQKRLASGARLGGRPPAWMVATNDAARLCRIGLGSSIASWFILRKDATT